MGNNVNDTPLKEDAPVRSNAREDKLKELTDSLKDGVKAVRDSAEYKKLLSVMAKFPHYSFNNCMLIAMQKPDATLCQGYNAWKKMGRYVKKGERGIKIIAPAPYTIQKEVDKKDRDGKTIFDRDGEPVQETKEFQVMSYKAETTFDVSQTDGKELPKLGVDELKGEVDKYKLLMDVLEKISPVPIGFEDIKSGAKGYYHTEDKRIAIQSGMSELQTLKTCIHEISHAMLHGDKSSDISKNRKELEAEGVAEVVLGFMGYDTSSYSHPYLAGYATDADMKELQASLGTIRKTSSMIIKKVEDELGDIYRERNPMIVPDNVSSKSAAKESVKNADNIAAGDAGRAETVNNPVAEDAGKRAAADNAGAHVAEGSLTGKQEQVVAERKILGTVRVLPDGRGHMKQSLLDNLRIRVDSLKNDSKPKAADKTREVAAK